MDEAVTPSFVILVWSRQVCLLQGQNGVWVRWYSHSVNYLANYLLGMCPVYSTKVFEKRLILQLSGLREKDQQTVKERKGGHGLKKNLRKDSY